STGRGSNIAGVRASLVRSLSAAITPIRDRGSLASARVAQPPRKGTRVCRHRRQGRAVEAPSQPPARRTLTPAVLLAVVFAVACAGLSIAFTAARGGLQVPTPGNTTAPIAAGSDTPEQPGGAPS